jgi:tripartite-type tricarboxylate transporter receptor subunit TctC
MHQPMEGRVIRLCMFLLLAMTSLGAPAQADTFPSRPIRLVIPFGAGGTADPLARMLADVIQKNTGATIIIEARPGGGGIVGATDVLQTGKDGYALLLGANNSYVVNPFLFPKTTIDPERDFSLVSILVDQPQVVYVTPNLPVKNFRELVDYIKARPGQVNYASPGVGSAPHMAGELVSAIYDLKMVHVPYRGGAPAVTALLAGEVQIYLASLSVGKAQIDAGKLKGLAVTAAARLKGIPDVPTTKEAGAPEFVLSNWWGLAAPAGLPAANVEWIHREFTRALQEPTVKARLEDLGFSVYGSTPAQFLERVREESAVYKKLIQERKLAIE